MFLTIKQWKWGTRCYDFRSGYHQEGIIRTDTLSYWCNNEKLFFDHMNLSNIQYTQAIIQNKLRQNVPQSSESEHMLTPPLTRLALNSSGSAILPYGGIMSPEKHVFTVRMDNKTNRVCICAPAMPESEKNQEVLNQTWMITVRDSYPLTVELNY